MNVYKAKPFSGKRQRLATERRKKLFRERRKSGNDRRKISLNLGLQADGETYLVERRFSNRRQKGTVERRSDSNTQLLSENISKGTIAPELVEEFSVEDLTNEDLLDDEYVSSSNRYDLNDEVSTQQKEISDSQQSTKKNKKTSKKGEATIQAIALSYDNDSAPSVTATGQGELAEDILRLAKEHDIPIHHDPDLAILLSQLDLHENIPENLYHVVAEVLAFAYIAVGKRPIPKNK